MKTSRTLLEISLIAGLIFAAYVIGRSNKLDIFRGPNIVTNYVSQSFDSNRVFQMGRATLLREVTVIFTQAIKQNEPKNIIQKSTNNNLIEISNNLFWTNSAIDPKRNTNLDNFYDLIFPQK